MAKTKPEVRYDNTVQGIFIKRNDRFTAKDKRGAVIWKFYPNDPCPCGSGVKYKKCCGKKH